MFYIRYSLYIYKLKYVYVYVYIYMYICIYIYRERERELAKVICIKYFLSLSRKDKTNSDIHVIVFDLSS